VTPQVTLRRALGDRALLGTVLEGPSWSAWRILLIAAMGEALSDEERAIFTALTGRDHEPLQRVEELVAVVGRRGGKSRAMATLAAYLAALCRHDLARGERGVLLCIAPDQRQAGITLDYATACFDPPSVLSSLVAGRTADTLELTNKISIEVRAASFRRLRGPTYAAVIADEAAFWYSDEFSSNADSEILNAVRPGLATTGGPLIIASSPYARRGVLWEMHRRHYGAAGDPLILVAQGESRTFNPSLPQSVVDRAMERDHASASAEYLANFRTDIESFVSREAVEACVMPDVRERPPELDIRYSAFVDPSGGSDDSFTLAIGHRVFGPENNLGLNVVDAIREARPPFSPEDIVREFSALLKSYRISAIQGDKYAGLWPVEQFKKCDIIYEQSARPKSDLYRDMLPLINSQRAALPDNARLISQLASLERRTARGGRDSIDHPPGQHDDLANCAAGLAVTLSSAADPLDLSWIDGDVDVHGVSDREEFARRQVWSHVMAGSVRRW
jgi:hypothetical protein